MFKSSYVRSVLATVLMLSLSHCGLGGGGSGNYTPPPSGSKCMNLAGWQSYPPGAWQVDLLDNCEVIGQSAAKQSTAWYSGWIERPVGAQYGFVTVVLEKLNDTPGISRLDLSKILQQTGDVFQFNQVGGLPTGHGYEYIESDVFYFPPTGIGATFYLQTDAASDNQMLRRFSWLVVTPLPDLQAAREKAAAVGKQVLQASQLLE